MYIYNIGIDKIIHNFASLVRDFFKAGHGWPLVLVLVLLLILTAHSLVLDAFNNYSPYGDEVFYSFGGPDDEAEPISEASASFLGSVDSDEVERLGSGGLIFVESASAVGSASPFSNVIPTRDGLMKYKVQEGDTLSEIAAQFGVSMETIQSANPGTGSVISPGEELIILPVSGILYEIKDGDTVEGISTRYKIDPELVKKHNEDYQELFESPGQTVILPYARPKNRWVRTNKSGLPQLKNYFQLPATGWNWGELHNKNAVDIAAGCGEPIYAAAEGLVTEAPENGLWNEGYGNYVLIEHPNETKTKYAHTLKNKVARGDYVLQGDHIATIGNSGNTHGPTGCHLHFEVHGAQNPFAVR